MNNQRREIEKIRASYEQKQTTKLDELRALDARVRRPAETFAYAFGTAGSLVLGTGMCLAMKVIGNMMPVGIVVGLAGIAMVAANYFLYKKILQKRKNKYAEQIFQLSDELYELS